VKERDNLEELAFFGRILQKVYLIAPTYILKSVSVYNNPHVSANHVAILKVAKYIGWRV
jgi:hypothetical protein